MFDGEDIRKIHYGAMGASFLSRQGLSVQLQAMYARMAAAVNEQAEAEVKPWRELVRDFFVYLSDATDDVDEAKLHAMMLRAEKLLATVPEPKQEEAE